MPPVSSAPRRVREYWIAAAALVVLSWGNTDLVRADEADSSEFYPSIDAIVDAPAAPGDFPRADASLVARSIFRPGPVASRQVNGTTDPTAGMVRLVSLETSPELAPLPSDPLPAEGPIYTMHPPEVVQADGNVYTGPSATKGTWVLIAPYGWIAGINGQVGVGNRVLNIDVTPDEVLRHLGNVDGALMLHAEAGKGDWGFIIDGNLIRASSSLSTAPAQIDVTLQQTLIEVLGMYRLVEASDYIVEGKALSVDLLGGGRYYQFANDFTIHPFNPALPTVPTQITSTWVDMVIGARARVPVTTKVDAFARADIGGFGMGSSSTLAWNVIAGVDWKMTSCSSLILGYRELNINRYSASGLTPFAFNAKLYGPFMAVSFQF